MESLKAQTYPFRECEILITLDRCDQRRAEWILELLPEARLLWLRGSTYFRSKNLALRAARGEFIVLVDSDLYFEPHWLRSLLSAFQPGIDLVTGYTRYQRGFLSRTRNLCDWPATRPSSGFTDWFQLNDVVIRRSLLGKFHFREDLGQSGGGAVNITRERLLREGVRFWFCAEAHGWHNLPPLLREHLRFGGYYVRQRRVAPATSFAWLASVPLLGPFLATGGTLLKAWQRAWRLRSLLPGGVLSFPVFFLTIAFVKAVELIGAMAYTWAPGLVSRLAGWYDVPPTDVEMKSSGGLAPP